MVNVDRRIHEISIHQHGLITVQQAAEREMTRGQLRARRQRGSLRSAAPGVYATIGTSVSWEQKVHAACLAAGGGALASHRCAAVVWELADPPAPVEIVVPTSRLPAPPGVIVHRSTDLRPVDIARRRGIPVTNPMRTVVDLGAVAPELVGSAVEQGLYKKLFGVKALWQVVDDLGRRGRRGVGVLRTVLEERALGDARACSPLEPVFAAIAADVGVPVVYQHPVVVDGHRYVLDFALPEIMVAVEVDGLEVHATRSALDGDLVRQNRLVVAGWHLLRYTATHLVKRRSAIKAELLDLVAQRS